MKNKIFYLIFIALCGLSTFLSFKVTDSFWLTALVFLIVCFILISLMCDEYFYFEEALADFSIMMIGVSSPMLPT